MLGGTTLRVSTMFSIGARVRVGGAVVRMCGRSEGGKDESAPGACGG